MLKMPLISFFDIIFMSFSTLCYQSVSVSFPKCYLAWGFIRFEINLNQQKSKCEVAFLVVGRMSSNITLCFVFCKLKTSKC